MTIDVAVSIAILHDQQIVLIKREDFDVWGLPSGQVEVGESVAQAAVREALEETGLHVQILRLVGVYCIPAWVNGSQHSLLFTATPRTRECQVVCVNGLPFAYTGNRPSNRIAN